ncbi:hypothetical protein AAW12_24430 [Sphingobacterium sp. Ag1]|uniref:hypothetical protein n=1 Tax=Sphingobacterium sp. Ag1 TaxID=1643451 RepID=UPI0006278649|nr:hypothetical protein [Sphingobacterium sp. Ag1]KKO89253.1 hypothetical protein AAW12_24430 [Sphingobacterium sp. Ag1]
MNGIIFQAKSLHVGCTAKFLFEPAINSASSPAVVELSTGEKAYAKILRTVTPVVTIMVGEYLNEKGKRMGESSWLMSYNYELKSWQIIENLN